MRRKQNKTQGGLVELAQIDFVREGQVLQVIELVNGNPIKRHYGVKTYGSEIDELRYTLAELQSEGATRTVEYFAALDTPATESEVRAFLWGPRGGATDLATQISADTNDDLATLFSKMDSADFEFGSLLAKGPVSAIRNANAQPVSVPEVRTRSVGKRKTTRRKKKK